MKKQAPKRLLKKGSEESMKTNWKVRFKNKVWLASFFSCILTFAYTILAMFDVYPALTENSAVRIVDAILMALSLMGVIVDPTTAGLGDSIRAQGYTEPYKDEPAVEESNG